MTYIICMTDRKTRDRTEAIAIRLSADEKALIEANASKYGFTILSEFIRFVAMNSVVNVSVDR